MADRDSSDEEFETKPEEEDKKPAFVKTASSDDIDEKTKKLLQKREIKAAVEQRVSQIEKKGREIISKGPLKKALTKIPDNLTGQAFHYKLNKDKDKDKVSEMSPPTDYRSLPLTFSPENNRRLNTFSGSTSNIHPLNNNNAVPNRSSHGQEKESKKKSKKTQSVDFDAKNHIPSTPQEDVRMPAVAHPAESDSSESAPPESLHIFSDDETELQVLLEEEEKNAKQNTMMTPEEQEAIESLRKAVEKENEALHGALFKYESNKDFVSDDTMVLRFLKARSFDHEKALEMIIASLKWRIEFDVEKSISNPPLNELSKILNVGVAFYLGNDTKQRPVLLFNVSKFRPRELNQVAVIDLLVLMLERGSNIMAQGVSTITVICDLTDFSYKNVEIEFVTKIINIVQNYYPERLGLALVLHPPWIFSTVWKMFTPLLDKRTVEKIQFVKKPKEELLQVIPYDVLPPMFGGTNEANLLDHTLRMLEIMTTAPKDLKLRRARVKLQALKESSRKKQLKAEKKQGVQVTVSTTTDSNTPNQQSSTNSNFISQNNVAISSNFKAPEIKVIHLEQSKTSILINQMTFFFFGMMFMYFFMKISSLEQELGFSCDKK